MIHSLAYLEMEGGGGKRVSEVLGRALGVAVETEAAHMDPQQVFLIHLSFNRIPKSKIQNPKIQNTISKIRYPKSDIQNLISKKKIKKI